MQLSKLYKVVKSLDSRCKLGANSEFRAILGCELYSLKQRCQRNVQNTVQCRDAKAADMADISVLFLPMRCGAVRFFARMGTETMSTVMSGLCY